MGMLWSQLSGGWKGTVTLNCNPSSRMTCSQASGGRPDGRVPSVCALALPPAMGGCLHLGPTPLLGERDWGGHAATPATTTTVTEGTFPSHLELSKSRSRACKPGCRTLFGPPSPRTGHTDTWRECAEQMRFWEVARNLTRPELPWPVLSVSCWGLS